MDCTLGQQKVNVVRDGAVSGGSTVIMLLFGVVIAP